MAETIKTVLTADSSQLRAEYAKAAATVQDYQRKVEASHAKVRTNFRAEMQALKLEASGRGEAAKALREKVSLQDQARKLAAQANIDEQMALRLLQSKLALEKQIAVQRRAPRRLEMELAPLTKQSLMAMDQATWRTRELRRQMIAAGRGGQMGSMGFLAFSQAVEDAQYGIRGVLNNIPQMVMGFGGSMGLAGALSLAAVAGAALWPVLKRLYADVDHKRIEDATKAWTKAFEERMETVRGLREEIRMQSELQRLTRALNQDLHERLTIQDRLISTIAQEIEGRAKSRKLADEIFDAESKLVELKGGNPAEMSTAGRAREMARMQEDLADQRELADRASAEAARIQAAAAATKTRNEKLQTANQERILELKKQLAIYEGDVAAAKSMIMSGGAGSDIANDAANHAIAIKRRNELKAEIQDLETVQQALNEQLEKGDEWAKRQLDTLQDQIQGAYAESEALESLIQQREKLHGIQRQIEQQEAANEAKKKAKEERKKQAEKDKRAAEKAAREAEKLKGQMGARGEMGTEIKALELELKGQKKKAEILRQEMRLRAEAAALAERTGTSEAEATRVLRYRARLQEEINRREQERDRRRQRPGIRRADPSKIQSGGGRINAGGGRRIGLSAGILNQQIQQRERERKVNAAAVSPEVRFLERQTDLQTQMLAIFNKFGVI